MRKFLRPLKVYNLKTTAKLLSSSLICILMPPIFDETMRYAIFLLGLLIFLGCANDNQVQETQINKFSTHNKPYELNFLNEIQKKNPSFDLALSLDQISSSSLTLTATLVLDSGDYVVSPYTSQDFLGVFDMSILDSSDLHFVGELIEFPPPSAFRVPFDDLPVLCYTSSTRISRSVEILSNTDFESYGEIFFVHEPSCFPYVISFSILRKSGIFSVTKLSTVNPNC